MKAQDIISRGIQETKFRDKTFSHSGKPDFTEEAPEIYKTEPHPVTSRPRTRASLNNSIT